MPASRLSSASTSGKVPLTAFTVTPASSPGASTKRMPVCRENCARERPSAGRQRNAHPLLLMRTAGVPVCANTTGDSSVLPTHTTPANNPTRAGRAEKIIAFPYQE